MLAAAFAAIKHVEVYGLSFRSIRGFYWLLLCVVCQRPGLVHLGANIADVMLNLESSNSVANIQDKFDWDQFRSTALFEEFRFAFSGGHKQLRPSIK